MFLVGIWFAVIVTLSSSVSYSSSKKLFDKTFEFVKKCCIVESERLVDRNGIIFKLVKIEGGW